MVGGEKLQSPAGPWTIGEDNCVQAQQRQDLPTQITWVWVGQGLHCTTCVTGYAEGLSGLHGQALPEASQALLCCWS